MSAFVKIDSNLVNVDAIRYVSPYSLYRNCSGTVYFCDGEELKLKFREPFEEVIAKILAASTVKEKENLPPTPPIREKEETHTDTPRACVREGFLVPTLAEVAAYIKANGLSVDAEKFWNHYNAIGWKVGKSPIRCWQSVCHVWDRGERRQALKEAAQLAHFDAKADERAEKRQAHIDAKMDERERKRERRAGGGRRKADNWVAMTDEVREAVRRDFDF